MPQRLFCLIFLLGVILFLVWAIRTLKKDELKKWVIGLLLVGLLGMIGSSLLMHKGNYFKDGKGLTEGKFLRYGGFGGCEMFEEITEATEAE